MFWRKKKVTKQSVEPGLSVDKMFGPLESYGTTISMGNTHYDIIFFRDKLGNWWQPDIKIGGLFYFRVPEPGQKMLEDKKNES